MKLCLSVLGVVFVLGCQNKSFEPKNETLEDLDLKTNTQNIVDMSAIAYRSELMPNCNLEKSKVLFGAGTGPLVSFEYKKCSSARYKKATKFFEDTQAQSILGDDWLVTRRKTTKYLGPIPVGVYLSDVLHIEQNVSKIEFRAYVDSLPEHCALNEMDSLETGPNETNVFEIVNTEARELDEKSLSSLDRAEQRRLKSELVRHNLSCHFPRTIIWANNHVFHFVERDVIELKSIKIAEVRPDDH